MTDNPRYDKEARPTGTCKCGVGLRSEDYRYHGGTFGYYDCPLCKRTWEVDLNGVMWEVAS